MKQTGKHFVTWSIIALLMIVSYDFLQRNLKGQRTARLAFSEFLQAVREDTINDVIIQGRNVEGHLKNGMDFVTYMPDYPSLVDLLQQHNVKVRAAPNDEGTVWGLIFSFGPILLLVGFYLFFMRQMQSGSGRAMGFGKSRARLMGERGKKVTFADVAGIDEAKEELKELVDFLKDPEKFQRLGGKIPRGCLLIGMPGTGKTLLARAIAGEANVPFFSLSGSDFVEMFVGVGASRVRDMFEQGKKNAPCIIFIDEIDAVGRSRGVGHGGGNDEREQTLNQLLVEMDGFEDNEGVIIVAATNRPDVLDPALLRPGRFDRQITVSPPDIKGREAVLNVHLKKVSLGPDIDPLIIARGTPGFSGADLANLVNEAALLAARKNKKVVTMKELEEAKDKILMGVERKSMLMTEEEKKLTAYHESGHALIAFYSPASDPIHKATIIPRGPALGMVMQLPERDRHSVTREKLLADLAVAMGGRIAEELIFGHDKVTTGAASDIQQATTLARNMVTKWGLSSKIGPIYWGKDPRESDVFNTGPKMAEETSKLIDAEVKSIVESAYTCGKNILEFHLQELHQLAQALLEHETLSGEEIQKILQGEPLERNDTPAGGQTAIRKSVIPTTRKISPTGSTATASA